MAEKAARWLRVSSDAQEAALQIRDVDGYISAKGYETGPTFKLDGKSATKGEQEPAVAEAVAAIERGEFTVLVVWALDRLDRRGIAKSFGTKQRIEDAGGRVEFVLQPTANDLEFAIQSWIAEQETQKKKARIQIGLDEARSNAAATQAPPWGLRLTGRKKHKSFVPSDKGRQFVPIAFERVAAGESCMSVAKTLGGKKWSGVTVAAMIHHTAYRGVVLDKAGNIVHRCEALVDADLWQRAHDAVAGRECKTRGVLPKALLAKVARCGQCDAVMYRTRAFRGQVTYSYYRCTNGCRLMVPVDRAEQAVDWELRHRLAEIEVTERRLIPGGNHDAEIEAIRFELRHLDLDAEDYDQRHAELRAELARLKALPATPDRWETVPTGQTMGDQWAARGVRDQAAWLHQQGFTVRLWREQVMVLRRGATLAVVNDSDHAVTLPLEPGPVSYIRQPAA